jgi:outer membrane protein assembly factor BamB
MNKLNIYVIALLTLISCSSEHKKNLWSFSTGDRILAHPMLDDGIVYAGSNDQWMYAIDANTGKPIWTFMAGNTIQSPAVVSGNLLFFESGNVFYALDKESGREVWKHDTGNDIGAVKLDPWDYHHPAPVIDDTVAYFACGDGCIYGLDKMTGQVISTLYSIDSAAVRATPAIEDGILYFGDWNGILYAWDLRLGDFLWSTKTYETQHYPTFGQINTTLLLYDTLLMFGARNPELQVLSKNTGEVVWRYTVPGGGWISGDPVVLNDTLYIGGSDCHRLFAFDVFSGKLFWEFEFLFNNFSHPLPVGENLVFTTGNAYAYEGNYMGNGYLYALRRSDGSLLNFEDLGGNNFNTPLLHEETIITAGSDGMLRTIDAGQFIDGKTDLREKGYLAVRFLEDNPVPFTDTLPIRFNVEYPSPVTLHIRSMDGVMLNDLYSGMMDEGLHSIVWDGNTSDSVSVEKGYVIVELASKQYTLIKLAYKTN